MKPSKTPFTLQHAKSTFNSPIPPLVCNSYLLCTMLRKEEGKNGFGVLGHNKQYCYEISKVQYILFTLRRPMIPESGLGSVEFVLLCLANDKEAISEDMRIEGPQTVRMVCCIVGITYLTRGMTWLSLGHARVS